MKMEMHIITRQYLRCPQCQYERQVPDHIAKSMIDTDCPACSVTPHKWAAVSKTAGAKPVQF